MQTEFKSSDACEKSRDARIFPSAEPVFPNRSIFARWFERESKENFHRLSQHPRNGNKGTLTLVLCALCDGYETSNIKDAIENHIFPCQPLMFMLRSHS